MQLMEALIEIGKQSTGTWAIRADNVLFAYRDVGNGQVGYTAIINGRPVAAPGQEISTLLHRSLPYTLSWLVEQGKRDLLFSDAWQIADPDELV